MSNLIKNNRFLDYSDSVLSGRAITRAAQLAAWGETGQSRYQANRFSIVADNQSATLIEVTSGHSGRIYLVEVALIDGLELACCSCASSAAGNRCHHAASALQAAGGLREVVQSLGLPSIAAQPPRRTGTPIPEGVLIKPNAKKVVRCDGWMI